MLALIFSMVCLIVAVRQKLYVDAYKDELGMILQEANAVKEELEQIMTSSVELSKNVTNDLDNRLQEYRVCVDHQAPAVLESESISEHPGEIVLHSPELPPPQLSQRIRVYEMAREMQLESRELVQRLQENGVAVKNHLSLVDRQVVLAIFDQPHIMHNETIILDSPVSPIHADSVVEHSGDNGDQAQVNIPEDVADSPDLPPETAQSVADCPEKANDNFVDDFTIEEICSAHPYIAVRTLHERGYAVWEIAKLLGRGQGEVNLILNLTRKKQA